MTGTVKKEKRKQRAKLVESAIIMIICLVILLYISLAWFSTSHNVTANNMQLSVAKPSSFLITADENTQDEALTFPSVTNNTEAGRLFNLTAESNVQEIGPGVSGSFSFWATLDGSTSLSVIPTVSPGGITVTRDIDDNITGYTLVANNGFRSASTDELVVTQNQKSAEYLKGHILLFLNYSGGVYSGWLNPDSETIIPQNFVSGVKQRVTVYWVWVDSYSKLTSSSTIISAADIQKIDDQYKGIGILNDYSGLRLFDSRGDEMENPSRAILSHYYDYADEDIGTSISNFHFDMKFSL